MDDIKKIVDELGITAFESNIKIASIAVVSDSGELIYQTDNWDLEKHTNIILNVINGDNSFVLNNMEFSVVESNIKGKIATTHNNMGHILFALFQGGVLVSYMLPKGDTYPALSLLIKFAEKLNGKL